MMIGLAAIASVLLSASALAGECERTEVTGIVTYVRDGDTIELGRLAIRLNGLAAPEWGKQGGTEARQAMIELVQGKTLRCTLDGSRTYDRCAGICYLDGRDISEVMVETGLARDCPRYSRGRYAIIEAQAVKAGSTIQRDYPLPGYCRPR